MLDDSYHVHPRCNPSNSTISYCCMTQSHCLWYSTKTRAAFQTLFGMIYSIELARPSHTCQYTQEALAYLVRRSGWTDLARIVVCQQTRGVSQPQMGWDYVCVFILTGPSMDLSCCAALSGTHWWLQSIASAMKASHHRSCWSRLAPSYNYIIYQPSLYLSVVLCCVCCNIFISHLCQSPSLIEGLYHVL